MDGDEGFSDFLDETPNYSDDIFSVFEAWKSASPVEKHSSETEIDGAPPSAKRKRDNTMNADVEHGQQRTSHITVERNRRKQMNHHLSLLRSLMPAFYVKRGDQASIIGGVVDYITELQQLLQTLESKKLRKAAYSEVLSPRLISSPRKPPLSPRTPQPSSPYKPWMQQPPGFFINSPSLPSPVDPSPSNSSASSSINDAVNELVATSKSSVAEVEVKFSGPNLLLKTVSRRIPGQVLKIVSALHELALQILHLSITMVDETMLYSFTIKIGIECQLSAEELAQQIQQTFC